MITKGYQGHMYDANMIARILATVLACLVLAACTTNAPVATPSPLVSVMTAIDLGNYTRAEAMLIDLGVQYPDNPEYPLELAELYESWGRPELGLPVMQQALNSGATITETQDTHLNLLIEAQQWDMILQSALGWDQNAIFAKAMTLANTHTADYMAASTWADVWVDQAPGDKQAMLYSYALSIDPSIDDRTHLCAYHSDLCIELDACGEGDACLAQALIRRNEWHIAVHVLERALDHDETDTSVLMWLGESLLRTGSARDGKQYLQQAIAYQPENATAWLLLGTQYLLESDSRNAHDTLFQAQSLDPGNPAPCLAILELKALDAQYDEMGTWADAAIIRAPEDIEVWKAVSRVYLVRGLELDGYPWRSVNHAVDVNATDAEAQFYLAWYYLNRGHLTSALDVINAAIDLAPNSGQYYVLKANILDMQGNFDEAALSRIQANNLGWFE